MCSPICIRDLPKLFLIPHWNHDSWIGGTAVADAPFGTITPRLVAPVSVDVTTHMVRRTLPR